MFCYPGDIMPLSALLSALQSMPNICENFAKANNVKYNCKKFKVVRIWLCYQYDCEPLQPSGVKLQFVDQMNLMRIYICSAKRFMLAYVNCKLKFYRCFNAIYPKVHDTTFNYCV